MIHCVSPFTAETALETLPDAFRPCAGIVVMGQDGLVFAGQRIDQQSDPQRWQWPQGGIMPGEQPSAAAMRELYEETSICDIELMANTSHWLCYELPKSLRPAYWQGRYRGQIQLWFLARFTGDEAQIRLNSNDHKPEFHRWGWCDIEWTARQAVAFKQAVYREVVRQFLPLIARHRAGKSGGDVKSP
ncbi:MAG: RNA pyrophosphohydrolase [Pseudomonadota bacterium]